MATVGAQDLTLRDWASRQDPDGKHAKIAEVLNDTNEILDDMVWVEANGATGHTSTIRSGLPSVAWRMLNYGVAKSKSRTIQVTDSIGMLETYSEVDVDLAGLNGNTSEFRAQEDKPFMESMSQEMAETLFYGNTDTDPEKYLGLAPRYNDSTAENGENILNGGGTGSTNTSIWLIAWADTTVHGIFPKGSTAGLQHRDLGEDTISDGNGGQYQAYRAHYKWNAGLVLRDWRYVVRIANIDVTALTKNAATGADLVDLMVQAIEVLPNQSVGRKVFYCNKTVKSFLRRQIKNESNVNLTMMEVMGKHVMAVDEVPVRKCDALLNTEGTVTFA